MIRKLLLIIITSEHVPHLHLAEDYFDFNPYYYLIINRKNTLLRYQLFVIFAISYFKPYNKLGITFIQCLKSSFKKVINSCSSHHDKKELNCFLLPGLNKGISS